MKKLISLLLALAMVFSMAVAVSAAEDPLPTTGSITITGAALDENKDLIATYTMYRMLSLESYDKDKGNYSYKVVDAWKPFFESSDAAPYFSMDKDGFVKWAEITGENREARAIEFSKLAIAWAKEQSIPPDKTTKIPTDFDLDVETDSEGNVTGTVKFSDLELGYYLVDSSVGALCGLTTTNPNVTMTTKNVPPTVTKKVQEDSLVGTDSSSWGSSNTADIGDTVKFDSTIEIETGAQKLVYHDKMGKGLTFDNNSVVVMHYDSSTEKYDTIAASGNYEVKTTGLTDGCTFEIVFSDTFNATLAASDKVIILYSATLNENAFVGPTGNINEGWLDYGDDHHTTHSTTVTKTFAFDLLKVDSLRTLLDGAEFELYSTKTEKTDPDTGKTTIELSGLIEFVKEEAGGNITYRKATSTDTTTVTTIDVTDGKVRVSGLDTATYYLKETKAPTGYNQITDPITVAIADANHDVSFAADGKPVVGSGVQVVNNSGTVLPQTGATGTTMFIFFGMFVMLSTGVLLVTKKRMSMIEE